MTIRKPAVAGMFYPADKNVLTEQLKQHFSNYKNVDENKNIFGIVAPHAGYVYSGNTAASVYNLIKGKRFNKVIVISPSHREYFDGVSIYNGEAYETPLGQIKINKDLSNQLIGNSKYIQFSTAGHKNEHALEVQLPFLQYTLEKFTLVPIVIGNQHKEILMDLAKAIAKIYDENTLIVASTDLSHFHSRKQASKLDHLVAEGIKDFDYNTLQKNLELNKCEACGGGGVVSLMKAAELTGFTKSEVIEYTDSGEVSGDTDEVVGYLSAVIYE